MRIHILAAWTQLDKQVATSHLSTLSTYSNSSHSIILDATIAEQDIRAN